MGNKEGSQGIENHAYVNDAFKGSCISITKPAPNDEKTEVNPDDTGPETKSNKNPNPRTPIINSIIPLRKHSNTAFGTFPLVTVKEI
uniref:Uncharacterized protein n=1 Tax=Megaselia scalaris TaxID=36166 RepID=T1GPD0_MEGSC